MKAYRKELNNLEDLRRERIRLKAELRYSSAGDFLNPFSKTSESKSFRKSKVGLLGTIGEVLGAENQLQTAIAIGKPLLKMLGKQRKKTSPALLKSKDKKDSILLGIAKEILTGYLLGKAVQLSFKGIKSLIQKKKKA